MRLLTGLSVGDPTASPQAAIAQRLGDWLDWTDAIPLSAVLAGATGTEVNGAAPPGRTAAQAPAARTLQAALARVRADLTRAITAEAQFAPGRGAPAGEADAGAGDTGGDIGGNLAGRDAFAPYRRACQSLQRTMGLRVAPLRQQARAALGQASARLARLAALDAVMDEWLAARERSLLAGVPTLLERRCEQLRQQWPEDWAARLGPEVQDVLLAELDVRLQPVEGLVEALGQEIPRGA